ncbi:Dehydrodolichyl diphosphate synthase complex subunit nus1 [Gryllus bimaculatus]|nr:Dehydrodolichyl diphosphate synthase complex subunit nus1 [Gryllus bimaculatus]
MLRVLYRIIWTFIYLLCSFVDFVKSMTVSLHKKYTNYYKTLRLEDELKLITQAVKHMDKTPSHIVFVIGNENISFRDLGNVIVWCIAAGVSFISFYDFEGELKKEEAHFRSIVSEVHKKYSGYIVWGNKYPANGVQNINGTKNGMDFLRKVKVKMFSLTDGKENIVKVTHELCKSVKENILNVSDINQDVIDRMIGVHSGVPDPDLAVLCGSLCCTYGLLPWQIRVTEFVQVHSHHNLSFEDFLSVLYKYNKCEQRFGK